MPHISKLLTKGPIHFTGIGGIGMSGIAEILHNLGHSIQGSDLSKNANTARLQNIGIKTFLNHNKDNIKDIALLVISTAIKDNNPEVEYCKDNSIPVITRTEMLAELMRLKTSIAVSGTHGKTTTTSMIASVFEASNLNPTVINGGIINTRGTNAYLGSGDFLIAEADESDATFIKVPSTIAVITNIDPEHLDYYGSFANLKKAFSDFINNLPTHGFGVLCIDHPEVRKLAKTIKNRRIITYGVQSKDADVQAINIKQNLNNSTFEVKISDKLNTKIKNIKSITLNIPGVHNVQNSLAAIAIALELKFNKQNIINGFKDFKGVKRRFTLTGEVNGIRIIDDYAHHPREIEATLSTAKQVVIKDGKIISVFQPHRYTRLRDLFKEFSECFRDSDIVYIADVYTANEEPIENVSRDSLIEAMIQTKSHNDVRPLLSPDHLPDIIKQHCKANDLVIFLGAGSITNWANELPCKLGHVEK
jgi:UDP-N-acetylmuramate--alanine ligase